MPVQQMSSYQRTLALRHIVDGIFPVIKLVSKNRSGTHRQLMLVGASGDYTGAQQAAMSLQIAEALKANSIECSRVMFKPMIVSKKQHLAVEALVPIINKVPKPIGFELNAPSPSRIGVQTRWVPGVVPMRGMSQTAP